MQLKPTDFRLETLDRRLRHRFVVRHRDEKRDGHDLRITKFMRPNGVRFGSRMSGAFMLLWRQGLPGEVIVDT